MAVEARAWDLSADLVFTSPMGATIDPTVFSEAFTKEARAAGMLITFHGLRHSHIAHLLRAGVPVHIVRLERDMLDHRSRWTPIRIFSAAMMKAAELADAMLRRALK